MRNSIKKLNNLCDFASLKIYTKLKSNYTYKLFWIMTMTKTVSRTSRESSIYIYINICSNLPYLQYIRYKWKDFDLIVQQKKTHSISSTNRDDATSHCLSLILVTLPPMVYSLLQNKMASLFISAKLESSSRSTKIQTLYCQKSFYLWKRCSLFEKYL